MSRKHILRNEDSVDEQVVEQIRDDDRYEPELRRSVDQEIQGKVDTNHPDSCRASMTLAQEEEAIARELEIERTKERVHSERKPYREAGSREALREGRRQSRARFDERAAAVDHWQDPKRADPRELLSQAELASVNEQAGRVAERLDGWTRAAVSRRLAERVVDGADMTDAVVAVHEELETAAGTVIPIGKVGEVDRSEVSVEGRVETLWKPSHPSIAQVGLIADDSGRTRVTIWKASEADWIREGEQVRIHGASVSWYEGRASLAVTGWSTLSFPERGRWWE